MLSMDWINDLHCSTPHQLTTASGPRVSDDPCEAALRWLAARGVEVVGITFAGILADRGLSELGAHAEFAALQRLALAERQANHALPPREDRNGLRVPEPPPALLKAASLHRSMVRLEEKTLLAQFEQSFELEKALEARSAALEELQARDREVWARYRELKHIQFRAVDPAVAAGYFHGRHVEVNKRRRTALHYYMHDCSNIPLLRCIAITGSLRRRSIPVDIDHPDLEARFATEERNLKRYRKRLRENQGTHKHGVYLHSC